MATVVARKEFLKITYLKNPAILSQMVQKCSTGLNEVNSSSVDNFSKNNVLYVNTSTPATQSIPELRTVFEEEPFYVEGGKGTIKTKKINPLNNKLTNPEAFLQFEAKSRFLQIRPVLEKEEPFYVEGGKGTIKTCKINPLYNK